MKNLAVTLFALALAPAAWAASPMVAHPPADFAGTGRSALLWHNTNGAAALWLMNGTTLQSAVQFGPYTGWSVLSGDADFNADGKSDLLWTHTNGAAAVWLMNGITQVSAASFGPYPGWSVVSGNHDFNGDGKSDLLWKNTDGSVAIWLMNGTTVLSQASFGPYPGWSIVSGDNDFNGDGKSDLLWKNSNGAAALWLMDGTTQTSATQFGPYTGWSILSGSSDFNGDGKTDLLWQNSNGAAALWLMNGLTQTSAAQFGPYTGWTVVPGRRDFNGDGKSDLLWSNSNGAAAVWLMNGLTQTSAASFGPFTGWSITGGIGDYNGDGKTDLLWSNSDGSAAVWLMNGTGQTSSAGFGPYSGWSIFTGSSSGSPGTSYNIGINVGSALDYETNRIFADVMKTSREWHLPNWNSGALTALDADGWPQQDASICVWAGIDQMQGTYALSFNGKATIGASWGSVTVTNQAYDANANQTTAKVVYNSADSEGLLLTFTNTQRTATSATNTGITNVVLMRPKTVGGTQPYTTEVFNTPFTAALASFSVLRTMDFSATNSNGAVNWSDRTRPGHASQAVGNPTAPSGGWQGRGGAWEYLVLLANQTGKDLWINVPVGATDDYITKLARLVMYGSDGTNPYTSTQAAPVWPGLAADRKLYVEFSNEVWNTAGAFQQSQTNHTAAQAEVAAGGSPLNFDGETNDWFWAWRRTAKRTVDMSNIFRSVWGDTAMMSQVRPVLMSQLGYADGPLLQGMYLTMNYYGNPAHVTTPRLPNYYIYGLGGSAYYGPSDKTSVDNIFSTMGNGFESALQGDANWALAFGLKRIAYEGGPSLDNTGNSAQDANQAAAWADTRMAQAITTQQTTWSRNAGDLLMYFSIAGDYQWGFMSDVLSPSSPKMTGIAAVNAASPAASTYGTPIPATLAASSAAVPPGWAGGSTSMSNHSWLGYPVSVSSAGRFKIALTASSASSAQAEILVDGNSLGIVVVPASGASVALGTPMLAAGSHGIVVRNATGSFNLSQIQVQAN